MKRVDKLGKVYDGITHASVVLDRAPSSIDDHLAEISINVYRRQLTARNGAATHEEAIDRCAESLRRQILRYKSKLRGEHLRR